MHRFVDEISSGSSLTKTPRLYDSDGCHALGTTNLAMHPELLRSDARHRCVHGVAFVCPGIARPPRAPNHILS
jgi:hypothetical protein